ncbi:MAG: DUF2812 domain-containing protein [Oscillospiraceae bacterium]|nr:DUF2812 domain-containing protein [Oscillospiraceae bacterium]
MDNNETKTVINIGWETVKSSLMKNFSAFAERGYILSEMDDRQFIFKKVEPVSADFFLYSEHGDKQHREYDALTENGWTELCSYGEYHMMTAPKDTPLPEKKQSVLGKKAPFITAAVISAALLALSIAVIPDTGGGLSVLRAVLIGISAGGMVFSLTRIFRKSNDAPSENDDSAE